MAKSHITPSVTPAMESVHVATATKELAKRKLQELIQQETKLVKGRFQCFETPGANATITIKKYPGIQPFVKTMMDGEVYEVPLYVARFLNGTDVSAGALAMDSARNIKIGTCGYNVHGFKYPTKESESPASQLGPNGVPLPVVGISKCVRRYGFQSLEFAGE